MAKETKETKVRIPDAPAGFTTNIGRARGDGWVIKKPGNQVQGRLLGCYEMKALSQNGEKRSYFQIKVAIPTPALQTLGEEDEGYAEDEDGRAKRIEVMLKPGDIINVDVITALKDLAPYTRDGGVYDVWFAYVKQDPKRRNFWIVKGPSLQTIRPGKPHFASNGVRSQDEIPF